MRPGPRRGNTGPGRTGNRPVEAARLLSRQQLQVVEYAPLRVIQVSESRRRSFQETEHLEVEHAVRFRIPAGTRRKTVPFVKRAELGVAIFAFEEHDLSAHLVDRGRDTVECGGQKLGSGQRVGRGEVLPDLRNEERRHGVDAQGGIVLREPLHPLALRVTEGLGLDAERLVREREVAEAFPALR